MLPIAPLSSASQVASAYASTSTQSSASSDFSGLVGDAAKTALDTLRGTEQVVTAGVSGSGADVQQVVQALSDAELTMQTVVAVRDRVLGAYNDIMKMTI